MPRAPFGVAQAALRYAEEREQITDVAVEMQPTIIARALGL